MKNSEKNLKNWTVGIGDDKVLDTMGEWGTTQDALNFYKKDDDISDMMTYEEALAKAKELNEKEELTNSLNKYFVTQLNSNE